MQEIDISAKTAAPQGHEILYAPGKWLMCGFAFIVFGIMYICEYLGFSSKNDKSQNIPR